MKYTLIKAGEVETKEKFGMQITVYPSFGDCELVLAETTTGHIQEFLHTASIFNYLVLEGSGSFFIDDEEIVVAKGDLLSISPHTRIYYKGALRLLLVTNPPWTSEGEVETKSHLW